VKTDKWGLSKFGLVNGILSTLQYIMEVMELLPFDKIMSTHPTIYAVTFWQLVGFEEWERGLQYKILRIKGEKHF
jgi:hypothetical protein